MSVPSSPLSGPPVVEAVLFDLFGVIARLQDDVGRAGLERVAGIVEADHRDAFWLRYWRERPAYDRAEVDSPGYWRGVGEALGTPYQPAQIDALVRADLASWAAFDAQMVALVQRWVADGRRVALLSNIPSDLAVHADRAQPWLAELEVVGYSCRIGAAKPQTAAFGWALDALALPAHRVLFTDDTLANVEAAAALGIRAHHFTSRAAFEAYAHALMWV